MLKKSFTYLFASVFFHLGLLSHCQMPCGIYHDEMVFDQIDQYVETMVKGMSILHENKFNTVQTHNEFIRWVILKETSSNEIASLLTTYFLQQKIKPDESETAKRVLSAHKLLFYLVQIKQASDLAIVNDFYEEWEKFKLMFHIENYKCRVNHKEIKNMLNNPDSKNKNLSPAISTNQAAAFPSQDVSSSNTHTHDGVEHTHF